MVSRNTVALFTGLMVSIFLLSSCQQYLEDETPAGTVPPPSPPAESTSVPSPQGRAVPAISQPPSRKAAEAAKASKQDTICEFAKVYAAKGSPRIAVFLNRSLSDEVRQWRTSERLLVSGEGEQVRVGTTDSAAASEATVNIQADTVNIQGDVGVTGTAEIKGSNDKQRALTIQSQQYIEEEKRQGPGERWMWAFEEGVLEPFLQAKANVIDRPTILRLAAAKSDEDGDIRPIAPKQIELDALRDHADILIELLVSGSEPKEGGGYTAQTKVGTPDQTPSEYDRFQRGVVVVRSSIGIGTGFFVTPEGHIVTNKHGIGDGDGNVSIKTVDHGTLEGKVVQMSEKYDLALVKISANSANWLNLADEAEYKTGLETVAVGAPVGLEWSVSKGILSAVRVYDGILYIQTDTPINKGNSGGPLISLETGNVIGVNSFVVRKDIAEGLNFAIASSEVARAFPSLEMPTGSVPVQSTEEDLVLDSTMEVSSPYQYEFKASVKDVKSGRILANVTSADWKGRRRGRGRTVVATESGYQLGGGMRLPGVKDVASELAIDVMDKLIERWSE